MYKIEKLKGRRKTIKWHDVVDGSDAKNKKHIRIKSKESKNLDALRGAEQVDSVWASGTKLTEEIVKVINSLPNLNYLFSLCRQYDAPLKNKSVEYLTVDSGSRETDLGFIKGCKSTKYLFVDCCLKIATLSGIESFKNLTEFKLLGAPLSWGTVDTLSPLAACKKLEYLSLVTRVTDKSLRPLAELPKLKYLWVQNRYRKDEYLYLLENSKSLKQIELHNGTFDLENGFVKDDD